ncbi:GNAT family N-acetyltransferase [Neobacillus novalis]|uniref:GNAT family N-acetyltransferase n=1 Tax=Neobacillus novalis TaxID=220687 RepID=A0AA95MNX2_9BACI|nr:GNAT family N-acetyltransferase [Neobacillus novalis]WHY87211.1 GNAT family N-acetyltransferase [Neobacillus novalis]
MFSILVSNDEAIAQGSVFESDEVQFNLFHRITEGSNILSCKTQDGKMIFAQTPGHSGWLWISKGVTAEERDNLTQELVNHLNGAPLPGVTGEPETAKMFADIFSKKNHLQYETEMVMEAYYCPKVIKPANVPGKIQAAKLQDADTVAEYLAGFLRDAFGTAVEPNTQAAKAETMLQTGNLYLWIVDGQPVSMANISHRSPRHARINSVFTPMSHRKKGYASALVAELCRIIESEKLVPMLYADFKNPDSNKVYQNIGFLESGKIAEFKFTGSPKR